MSTRFGKVLDTFGKLPTQTQREKRAEASSLQPMTGRPPGKKTNPDFTQVTVYLHKQLHREAKKILLDEERDFSELVDELVAKWLETSRKPKV